MIDPTAVPGSSSSSGALDPASLQVLISRLTGIAEEMGAVLRRAAYSPNIKERADCSAALFTADGELLVQAEHIPVHLGSMPASVRAAIDRFGDTLHSGEQVILNDPFEGGTHLNDVTLVAPCIVDGRLVGWAANRAHHADLGGMVPGSIPPDATEIQQEGLRIPPVRLTDGVAAIVFAASRSPEERRGDLDAQVGANVVGVARLAELADAPLDEVVAYGERRMRAALAALPDGEWRFEDVIDSTGPAEHQQRAATIRLRLSITGDEAVFDFTGTDAQRPGNVNAVAAVTASCVAFAVRAATDPTIPANGGTMRPVHVIAPAGTLVAASPPAAVGAGNVEVSQRIADVCLGAFASVAPDRVGAASQGTMNNVVIGGASGWVYYETIAGGQGARPGRDGMSGVHTVMTNTSQVDRLSEPPRPGQSGIHTGMTNTLNTPTEALERAYPMRVLRYRLRRGSGGRGLADGGEGIERDLLMLEDVTVSLITERRVSRPWGLAGGEPGAVGENWLLPGGDESRAVRLLDKCTVALKAGDVLRVLTPGGGGWGLASAPLDRGAWLDGLRAQRVQRFDDELAAVYDEEWGAIGDTHARYVEEIVASLPAGATVLDAACGTGRFFPTLLSAGIGVVGIDESEGMLAQAAVKHPDVRTRGCRVQELRYDHEFDAVLCIDALEYVPPEDWPTVLANLARAAKPGAPVYVTVELAAADEIQAAYRAAQAQGVPVVRGEVVAERGRYHFYPRREVVRDWLSASGLTVVDESDGDSYWHLLCRT